MASLNRGRIVGTLVFGLVLLVLVPVLILGNVFVATFPPIENATAKNNAESVVYYKPELPSAGETAEDPSDAPDSDITLAPSKMENTLEDLPSLVTVDEAVESDGLSSEALDELFEPTGVYATALALAAANNTKSFNDQRQPVMEVTIEAAPQQKEEQPIEKAAVVTVSISADGQGELLPLVLAAFEVAPPEAPPVATPEAKPESKPQSKPEASPEASPEAKPEAKPEPPMPKEPSIVKSPSVPVLRVWRSPSGKEVEGTLIRVQGEIIEFRTKSGKVVKSATKFFSEEDQVYIKTFEHLK